MVDANSLKNGPARRGVASFKRAMPWECPIYEAVITHMFPVWLGGNMEAF
jgi:hypothetical protein